MRFATFIVLFASAAAVTACGVSRRHSAAPVTASAVADLSNDPSYNPPDEMELGIDAKPVQQAAKQSDVATTTEMKPNRQEKPRGSLHAATY